MKDIFIKIVAFFSVVRLYNIIIIVLAQYLTSIFIISGDKSTTEIILDFHLFLLVLCSSITIASGYIINNFYDYEKDLINKPTKTKLDKIVRKRTKLYIYLLFNFLTIIIAQFVSWKAVLFFSLYIFVIWYYSHKLKKTLFLGNLVSSILSIIPFFVILIYLNNFDYIIFVYASFLFCLVYMRELVKDLENIKGDFTLNYKTIPVHFGEKFTKMIILIITFLGYTIVWILTSFFDIGFMYFYFYFSVFGLFIFQLLLWNSNKKKHYLYLHNLLKIVIVLGVFSIILINPKIFVDKFLLILSNLIYIYL